MASLVAWYYDYNPSSLYAKLNCSMADQQLQRFVPMFWCDPTLPVPPNINTSLVLGFNEPNNVHNCNKSPRDIAQAWGTIMDRFPSSRLVSPSMAGNGIPYLDQFFSNCTAIYGTRGCRLDYIALHDYTCDVDTLVSYLEAVYQRYGFPIWLTEFACGDHTAKRPLSDQLAHMRASLPRLDALDYVVRYAWMSARQEPGDFRGLIETLANGTAVPTELGRLYLEL